MSAPEKDVQHRIRINDDYRSQFQSLLDHEGLVPIRVEERSDGSVSFCLGKVADDVLLRVLDGTPKAAFALQARIHN